MYNLKIFAAFQEKKVLWVQSWLVKGQKNKNNNKNIYAVWSWSPFESVATPGGFSWLDCDGGAGSA